MTSVLTRTVLILAVVILSGESLSAQTEVIIHASDADESDHFGISVCVDGDTVVVGAGGAGNPVNEAGAAYVYSRNQGGVDNWGEVAILRASDAQASDWFGSVSVDGDTVVVGAFGEDGGAGDPASDAGATYIYSRNQGGADTWGEVAILRASDAQPDDLFGIAVSIDGDTAVVGAQEEDGGAGDPVPIAGAAYVYFGGPVPVELSRFLVE